MWVCLYLNADPNTHLGSFFGNGIADWKGVLATGYGNAARPPPAVILATMQCDQAVIDRWSGAAPFWEKHLETIRQMFAPVTQALVEDAQIAGGHTVLDVATGPGEPALGIAAVVEPEGKVVGVDPIPEMVAAARRSAIQGAFRNTKFDVAHADNLPFPPDNFDAVVSRFGVMFVPSPVDAVREMLRVLKPGRNLAFAVWHLSESNPFFYTLSQVIELYVDSAPLEPDAPDAFRFASSGKLRKVLDEAGAVSSHERVLRFTIQTPMSSKTFGRCESRCPKSFGKRSRCFPPSSRSQRSARLSKL